MQITQIYGTSRAERHIKICAGSGIAARQSESSLDGHVRRVYWSSRPSATSTVRRRPGFSLLVRGVIEAMKLARLQEHCHASRWVRQETCLRGAASRGLLSGHSTSGERTLLSLIWLSIFIWGASDPLQMKCMPKHVIAFQIARRSFCSRFCSALQHAHFRSTLTFLCQAVLLSHRSSSICLSVCLLAIRHNAGILRLAALSAGPGLCHALPTRDTPSSKQYESGHDHAADLHRSGRVIQRQRVCRREHISNS